MVGFFMVFFYGEFISLLKMAAFKKKSRSYIAYVYILMVGAIVVGGYLKRQAQLRNTWSSLYLMDVTYPPNHIIQILTFKGSLRPCFLALG